MSWRLGWLDIVGSAECHERRAQWGVVDVVRHRRDGRGPPSRRASHDHRPHGRQPKPASLGSRKPAIGSSDRWLPSRCVWAISFSATLSPIGGRAQCQVRTERAGRPIRDLPAVLLPICVPFRHSKVALADNLFEDRHEVAIVSVHDVTQLIAKLLLNLIPER